MAQELLFTSAPKGLRPGASGFCTVAVTQGMSPLLTERLESLSGYRHLYLPGDPQAALNPVNFSHVQFSLGSRSYSSLSRIASFGSDYTHRSNKLAHHLVLDPPERPKPGPAWLLSQPQLMRDQWDGEVAVWPQPPSLPNGAELPAQCRRWAEATGDGGWGGALAEAALADPSRPCYLIFALGADILPLIRESIALLPPQRRWDVTFSTFYTGLPQDVRCAWRGVVAGSDNAQAAQRHPQALVIDLTQRLPQATGGELVATARTGQAMKLPATGSGRFPVPAATPPVTFAPAVPPPVVRDPPSRDAVRREPRVEWLDEADDSSGTYRLMAAPVSPPPPPLVAVPMGAPPPHAPPSYQAVPVAPPPARPEPPPMSPLPPGMAVWKPIMAIAAAVLLLGIGILLGRRGNAASGDANAPRAASHEGSEMVQVADRLPRTPERSTDRKVDGSADPQSSNHDSSRTTDSRSSTSPPHGEGAAGSSGTNSSQPRNGGRPSEPPRHRKPDSPPKTADARPLVPVELPLIPIANPRNGEVQRLSRAPGDFYFWLVTPAEIALKSQPADLNLLAESNKNRLEIQQTFELGGDPETIARVAISDADGSRRILLDWKQVDPTRRNALGRAVLIAQDQSVSPPERHVYQLCPPVTVSSGKLQWKRDKRDFSLLSRVSLEQEEDTPRPVDLLADSVESLEWSNVELQIKGQRFAFTADDSSKPPAFKFRSPALDEQMARLVALGPTAPIKAESTLSISVPASGSESHLRVTLDIAFPGQSGVNFKSVAEMLEKVRSSREQTPVSADALDKAAAEKKRQDSIDEVNACLELLEALRSPDQLQLTFKAHEKVGRFDVVRLEARARPAAPSEGTPANEVKSEASKFPRPSG